MGSDGQLLSRPLAYGFLTAFYNELMDTGTLPESFVAIAGTFIVVMENSSTKSHADGLQLVHTLWKMAIKVCSQQMLLWIGI